MSEIERHASGIRPCANCGQPVDSLYCPQCGQHNSEHQLSLKGFITESFNEQFGVDSKVWRTLWMLVRRPGFLTTEYVAGRRIRYMTPFKLYLLTSFLFFITFAWRANSNADSAKPLQIVSGKQPAPKRESGVITVGDRELPKSIEEYERIQNDPKTVKKDSNFERAILHGVITAQTVGRGVIVQQMLNNAPKVIFLLLPIFALFLKLFYWTSRKWYIENLIFALHGHAFLFLLLALCVLLQVRGVLQIGSLVVIPVYTFVALRTFYGESVFKSLVKECMLGLLYLGFLLAVIVATALLTLATA